MKVNFVDLSGKKYSLEVNYGDKIKTICDKLFEKVGGKEEYPNGIKLVINAQVLDDNKTVKDYKIKKGDNFNISPA